MLHTTFAALIVAINLTTPASTIETSGTILPSEENRIRGIYEEKKADKIAELRAELKTLERNHRTRKARGTADPNDAGRIAAMTKRIAALRRGTAPFIPTIDPLNPCVGDLGVLRFSSDLFVSETPYRVAQIVDSQTAVIVPRYSPIDRTFRATGPLTAGSPEAYRAIVAAERGKPGPQRDGRPLVVCGVDTTTLDQDGRFTPKGTWIVTETRTVDGKTVPVLHAIPFDLTKLKKKPSSR